MKSRSAFTLIEVLLAVFIIGLGSIGLFALFAGVAAQQTRSAELTRAVSQAQGLLGAMEGRVGPIGEWTVNGAPFIDPLFGHSIVRGVWYPAFSYYGDPQAANYNPSLTINPRVLQLVSQGRYFTAPKVEVEIYTNPPVLMGVTYAPAHGSSSTPPNFNTANYITGTLFNGVEIVRLPVARAALGTVEIEFWKSSTMTGAETLAFAVSDIELRSTLDDNDLANVWIRALPPGPIPGNPAPGSPPFVVFNYAELANSDPRNSILAGIDRFDLDGLLEPDEWISSIRVRYAHRGDRLLALGERLITTPDDTRPSGRRATVGATAMYRITPRGRSQFVTIAYTVTPLDRVGDFIPPENPIGNGENITNGLLRVYSGYDLYYDTIRNEYYLTWPTGEDDFALAEGDIVIVGGRLSPFAGSPLNELGADEPVRVSRVLTVGSESRAYLDDTPRVMGRSMAVSLNANRLSRVYTLRREVRSLYDQSRWELRPVLYQTLDVQ